MKVVYFNLNVGSAIEYSGNIIKSWLLEIPNIELVEAKEQSNAIYHLNILRKENPDLIIINEYYRNVVEACTYYKLLNNCKIIFIWHVWQSLTVEGYGAINNGDPVARYSDFIIMKELLERTDDIFCVNYCQDLSKIPDFLRDKFLNFYYPTDDTIFNTSQPWIDRKKDFLYIGNILNHKLSINFIKKLKDTNIKIDCYGKIFKENIEYNKEFGECSNLDYLGVVDQIDVPNILNQYKYLVMAHDGYEPFNWVLLQAMFCGTIPLVMNNRYGKFDSSWIDWANGLKFECNTTMELINNIIKITKENPDMGDIAEQISIKAKEKFNYLRFKNKFQKTISSKEEGK